MKNNKKAFTLIEVVGIITILSLMLLVTVPALTKTLKRNEQEQYNNYVNNLKMATESYIVKNINNFPELSDFEAKVYVEIKTLLKEGYIKEIQDDPNATYDEQPDSVLVTLNADGTFNFEVVVRETEDV